MIANAALITFSFFVVVFIVLIDRLKFLIFLKPLIFHAYGQQIGIFSLMLFLNMFLTICMLLRRFFLKGTGQKLLHFDKQVKTVHSPLSREIAEKYEE